MDRTPVNRGIPLECGAALPHPRSGPDLQQHCRTPNACHGHPGQAHRTGLALAEWLCRTADRIDPTRVRGPFHVLARRIYATSCEPTLIITMTSERTGHWIKMRRSLAPFSGSDLSIHTRS
jgi:hypothetical protein